MNINSMQKFAFRFSLLLAAAVSLAGEVNHRAAFLKLIDRPRVPLAAEVKPAGDAAPFAHYHFSYAADADQRVPGILVKPASAEGKLPVVIALHGTGGKKESQLTLLKELAGKGFIGVAIDGRYPQNITTPYFGPIVRGKSILSCMTRCGT
jgi:cephalosporin-C deacetylase-like acetyl esterase